MTVTSDAFPASTAPAAPLARTRPFFWSVRRELWENRAIYVAAPIAAAVVLFGVVLGHTAGHMDSFTVHGRTIDHRAIPPIIPYMIAAGAILATSCITGVFYCLASLNAERRDRSVLFWKSLPVSDLTTVLSKATVPALIMPLVTLATIFVTHLLMLGMDIGAAAMKGQSTADLLSQLPLGHVWIDFAYAFLLLAAWWAPLWSWLLLVSAWAKRMTFLWAVAPPLALCVIERMAFGTDYAWKLLSSRLLSGIGVGFTTPPEGNGLELPWPDPLPFLASPGPWLGLIVAAAFLAGAVWLRRRREPI